MFSAFLCFALGFGAARVPWIREQVDGAFRAGWKALRDLTKNRSNS